MRQDGALNLCLLVATHVFPLTSYAILPPKIPLVFSLNTQESMTMLTLCEAILLIIKKTKLLDKVEIQNLFLTFSSVGEVNVIIGQMVVSE